MAEIAKRLYTALWWLCVAVGVFGVIVLGMSHPPTIGDFLVVLAAYFLIWLPLLLVFHWIASGRWHWGWRW